MCRMGRSQTGATSFADFGDLPENIRGVIVVSASTLPDVLLCPALVCAYGGLLGSGIARLR